VHRTELRRRYLVLGLRLARARKAAKLTQTEVAKRLGYRQYTLSRMEKGERRPNVFELAAFVALYRVEFHDLVAPATDEELKVIDKAHR
jgi:transcriptional regulator with XRE-family HTH domain